MRLFVTGDVHGNHSHRKLKQFRMPMKNHLSLNDYLVICGDFGLIWDGGKWDKYAIETVYKNFPCTILWVDGNHENFDALDTYPLETWHGGKVHRISDRILHLCRGEVFTLPMSENVIKIFSFGGAKSTDRGYDMADHKCWWPQELPSPEEKDNALTNLIKHNFVVDYIFPMMHRYWFCNKCKSHILLTRNLLPF